MAEQNLPGEYENPYKFNAKELDTETDLYYYGARYYNPRLSICYGVDPLAIWNPVMETEFYGDGQHNGGVYYWGNLNPYIYTYQNPIKYIDPNGKQTEAIKKYLGNLWNDWSPFNRANQRFTGESERDQNRRLSESTIRNLNQTANAIASRKTANDLLNTALKNPDQKLLYISDLMQDGGDAMAVAGYALTLSVVGAEIGVPLAALGNAVSTVGSGIELTVNVSQSDLKGAAKDFSWIAAGELVNIGISKIPGLSNQQAKTIKENLTEEIIKQNVGIKLKVIERATDRHTEKNKKGNGTK